MLDNTKSFESVYKHAIHCVAILDEGAVHKELELSAMVKTHTKYCSHVLLMLEIHDNSHKETKQYQQHKVEPTQMRDDGYCYYYYYYYCYYYYY